MRNTSVFTRVTEIICAFLLAAGLATIQILIGGTRLLFSLPVYALLALIGILSLFLIRRPKPEPNQLCLITAALFFGYIIGRALLSPVEYLARADIYSVLGGLVIYLFVACLLTQAKRRMVVLSVLLFLALVHVVIGAIQFRNGDNFMLISFLQRPNYARRASGFYACPNHLAGLLEVVGVFGLSIVCWSRWPSLVKLLIAYAVGVCYLGLVLTGSRGGYLSTTTSLLVFGLLSLALLRQAPPRLFWRIAIPAFVAAIVVAGAVVFFVKKSDFLSGRAQSTFETTNMRVDLWKAALQQWKLEPIIGTGSGSYLYYGRQFRTDRVTPDPVYVHNDYLHLLAEYGLVGAALFLPFLITHLANGWKEFRRLGPKRIAISHGVLSNSMALEIGALAALSAYLVHSALDFNLHIPANVLLMAFVFGILANAGTQRTMELAPPSWAARIWRLLAAAIAVVIAIQCARLLPGEYYTERARAALRDYEPEAASRFAVEGLAWEKKNPDLYRYLGTARVDQADDATNPAARTAFYESAIVAFEKGRMLAPRDKNFAVSLGLSYDELGRFTESEWMFNEALALDPKSEPTKDIYQAHLRRWRTGKIQTEAGDQIGDEE